MLVVVYEDSLCKKLGIYKLVEDKDITGINRDFREPPNTSSVSQVTYVTEHNDEGMYFIIISE